MLCVKIRNKPRLNRSPSQPLLRLRAGSRAVDTKEGSDPTKVIGCLLARLADNRYVQMPADDLGDLSSQYALVGHAVIRGCSAFLKREPVKVSGIEPVHCGPAVEPVADICRDALFTCDGDQARHKAVIPGPVDRW